MSSDTVRVPTTLFLLMSSAIADLAVNAEVEVSASLLMDMREILGKHPEAEVSRFYRGEIARLISIQVFGKAGHYDTDIRPS